MNKIQSALLTALALGGGVAASDLSDDCGGKERWLVKILADPNVHNIDFQHTIQTSVGRLAKLKTGKFKKDRPREGAELKVFQVKCRISDYLSEGDKDVHLVLTDLRNGDQTMIGEIPDPTCPRARKSGYAKYYLKALNTIRDLKKKKEYLNHEFIITGVGFVDYDHRQTGHAPNNLELHPILTLEVIN